jgi:hypothetical protein
MKEIITSMYLLQRIVANGKDCPYGTAATKWWQRWENLSQCYFFHYKFHMDCPGMNLALCAEKLATNCLSYDMAGKYLQ